MLSFIRDHSLASVRKKLILLYILNVLDIVFTLILQSTGYFMEANPVMAVFVASTFSALAVKILLPAALCIFLYYRLKKATDKQLKRSNVLVTALLFIYACINILHMIWLSLYLIHAS
ncbi:MAG: DUF5658 family protein [Eubacteriales bacterium]|nr:DUF5658 family protein [Eubacteriales bacterium]